MSNDDLSDLWGQVLVMLNKIEEVAEDEGRSDVASLADLLGRFLDGFLGEQDWYQEEADE